ncbi:nitrate reductase associated protein [Synechocystis sp. PCC 7509]|uniref:nitrate reductase associated protein n=1 Tax=Synechocystis sp. PCC 7509 TaxID=927677 RepID=UPI0002ABB80F|nr:nitrate reductase associated protein [Synechocystis sp. PCC 7509]
MTFFEFEADFVDNLRCIPMQVRLKLDTCGIKLKLADWTHFSEAERQAIALQPCITTTEIQAYRQRLQTFVQKYTGSQAKDLAVEAYPEWMDDTNIPISLQAKVQELGAGLTIQQWQALTPLQRFALIKLSRPSHENKNFLPALQEFHLV